ncbi:MAG: hypothetical protein AAF219_07330 [Myxococcota bacterium]
MSELHVLRFFHLVAAAVWVGGLLVLAPLIVTLNKHERSPSETEQEIYI